MNFSLGRLLVVPTIMISLSACQITNNNAGSIQNTANEQFNTVVEQLLDHRKSKGLYKQDKVEKEEKLWPDLSPQALEKKYQERVAIASIFEAINQDYLSDDNKINYSIIKAQLDNNVANYQFKSHYMPFKSESGFHSNLNFVINNTTFKKEKDIELYFENACC